MGLFSFLSNKPAQTANDFYVKGREKVLEGKFAEAVPYFTKMIRLQPEDHFGYLMRASAQSQSGNYTVAIADFIEGIRLKPNSADAHCDLGIVYARLDQFQKAIECYDQAIRLRHDFATAYYNRAISRDALGDHSGAIEDNTIALRLTSKELKEEEVSEFLRYKPSMAEINCNRGIAKFRGQDYDGAIEDLSEAIRLKPSLGNAFYYRGCALGAMQKYNQAIDDYTKALENGFDDDIVFSDRGYCRMNNKDLVGSVGDFNEAVKRNPKNSTTYIRRGIALYSLNEHNLACADFVKARSLGHPMAAEMVEEFCVR